ncbi:MAG: hypothetical protein H0U75_07395 [Legionella sp.]|nr:hypothetical protein [Legionella sp.]
MKKNNEKNNSKYNFKTLGISLMFPIMIVISSPSMALGQCTLVACQCTNAEGGYENKGRYNVEANQTASSVCTKWCQNGVHKAICITTAP